MYGMTYCSKCQKDYSMYLILTDTEGSIMRCDNCGRLEFKSFDEDERSSRTLYEGDQTKETTKLECPNCKTEIREVVCDNCMSLLTDKLTVKENIVECNCAECLYHVFDGEKEFCNNPAPLIQYDATESDYPSCYSFTQSLDTIPEGNPSNKGGSDN